MAKQSLLWTALPNGYSDDRRFLRVSLLVAPRLHAEGDTPHLSTFPGFVDWPATLAQTNFTIHYGARSVVLSGLNAHGDATVDDRLGRPDSDVWHALFPNPDRVMVEGYQFRDLTTNFVLSYPTATIDNLVRDLYTELAVNAGEQLPTGEEILNNNAWLDFVSTVNRHDKRELYFNYQDNVRNTAKQFEDLRAGKFKSDDLPNVLARFQLFHTPASKPKVDKYDVPAGDPRARARWLAFERTELPAADAFQARIDFHQIVAAMGQYPTLLRLLGLVVDIKIRRDAFDPSPGALLWAAVLPPRSPGVTNEPDVSPRTRALLDSKRFQALPRPSPGPEEYQTSDGLLDLDKKLFDLLQADVDGGGLKVTNFARTLGRLLDKPDQKVDPVSKLARETGAPALRNAGLMLVHHKRGEMLKAAFVRQKAHNEKAEKIKSGLPQPPPTLFAEDLTRGWRVDIWDGKTETWHSLCRRSADYNFDEAALAVSVAEEEGCVRLAATKAADTDPNDPAGDANNPNGKIIWLHEAVVSWTGWSLCAPPPGKTIGHLRADDPALDHTDPVVDPEPEVPPGLHLRTAYRAVPGSLPRLRYGRRYWLRARAVDLAGNSLEFQEKDFGPEKARQRARPYLRFDPISAPALALYKPTAHAATEAPFEGESMDRLAVRTFNADPTLNNVPSAQRARRFAVPSRTSAREAELHGMLDRNGAVDAAFFAMLAAQDNSLAEEKIPSSGPLDEGTPVEVGYAVMAEGEELPYLPEPLAVTVAARFFNHPNFPPDKLIPIPLYDEGEWPTAAPFKIELYEEPGKKPHFNENTRTLLVPLPKAERATLRLSVKPTQEALELLGVWNWLTAAQKAKLLAMALDGQHWMLTPWRHVELVHAVQKPLIKPDVHKHKQPVDRGFGDTYALPNFIVHCHIKSTDRLDLLAKWNEPADDLTQSAGENRARDDHAFTVKITERKNYHEDFHLDYFLEAPNRVQTGGNFHDFVKTKAHEFNDTRYRRVEYHFEATTAFREYMPPEVLTEKVNNETVPTDKNIKVVGDPHVTWIPSSAPPPAPDVLYVVPTFGWERWQTTTKTHTWRRGGGLRVYLDRPWHVSGYGEMLAVVLKPEQFFPEPNTQPAAQPLRNFVTQWGNDPIWLSPFVPGVAPKRGDFPLARTAPDPTGRWLPSFAPPEEADQRPGPFPFKLQHPEWQSAATQNAFVEVAPHDVFYDEERQLWYCDIEIDWGAAYYPFVRLALARYQPIAHHRAHLSNIVIADFMQLVPDRWLTVTGARQAQTRRVTLSGFTHTSSSSHIEAKNAPVVLGGTPPVKVAKSTVVEVWLERFHPALGEDFGWKRVEGGVVEDGGVLLGGLKGGVKGGAKAGRKATPRADIAADRNRARQLFRERDFSKLVREDLVLGTLFSWPKLWEGTVTLPTATADGQMPRHRLAVAEYEEYIVDDEAPYHAPPTKKDRRLVFIEYVELS
jgi:hypothetical protein